MNGVWISGVGVLARGLPDWPTTCAVLSRRAPYADAPLPDPLPALLPANERRRASASVRWALAAGHEALAASGRSGEEVATVFASCGGDGTITHQICEALATPAREISPTKFHNSVHNAPAGYWSIATRSRAPSTSVCGYLATFAAGLLEAVSQAIQERRSVLLVAYDLPYPQPMRALWPVSQPVAVAILLEPASNGGAYLDVELLSRPARLAWPDTLPRDMADNPAAHALPVLAALAVPDPRPVEVPYLEDSHLAVRISS
ncbi:MAG: beta-ketoacyl synthase chain length factor [Betaproteobacteria bacterium]